MSQTFNLGGLGDNKLTKLIFSNGTANTCSVFLDNDGYLVFEQGASTVTFPLGDLPADTRLAIENGRVVKGKVITYEISGGSEDTSTSTETVSAGYPTGMYAADNLSNYPGFTNAMYFDGSSYLSRTPTATGSSTVWTLSMWLKRASTSTGSHYILARGDTHFSFGLDNFAVNLRSSTTNHFYITNAVYRDLSSWYHFVVSCDLSNSEETNKLKVYLNGELISVSNLSNITYQNASTSLLNTEAEHAIGRYDGNEPYYVGYLANIQLIDGQALDASNFGQYMVDSNGNTTSAWVPKLYDGDYGTNGFLLDFSSLELNSSGEIIQVNDTAPKSDGQSPNNWTAN